MTEKKRPPRFEDIAARSHRPPVKRPVVSPFALAYDAQEARKEGSSLRKASPDDFAAFAVDTNPPVDTNRRVDAATVVGVSSSIDANTGVDPKRQVVDAKVGANSSMVDTNAPTIGLTPNEWLTPTSTLTPTCGLTPRKKNPPSWRMSRLSIRLDKEKLHRLHFVAMSRGITLQDLIGGWADAFLADEGLTPTTRLTAMGGWHQTDQMIDDAVGTSTSSILERPEELLAYYAKWTGNPIRESDWQAMRFALSYTPAAIKAGILMSILRTKTKVNSFKYCLGAIDEVAKAGIVGTVDHVRYLEMKVEKVREGSHR